VVSAWGAADHRRHDTGRGDPEDPPASEAHSRPTPDCSGACPSGSLLLVLCLTVSGGSPTCPRSRRLGSARSPRLILRLQSPPTPPIVGSVLHARTRVHQSLTRARCPSGCTRLSRRPSAALTALQELLHQSLKQRSSRLKPAPLAAAPAAPAARHPAPSRSVLAGRAGCRQGWWASGVPVRRGRVPGSAGWARAGCWEAPAGVP
jgi:hypothetical protein